MRESCHHCSKFDKKLWNLNILGTDNIPTTALLLFQYLYTKKSEIWKFETTQCWNDVWPDWLFENLKTFNIIHLNFLQHFLDAIASQGMTHVRFLISLLKNWPIWVFTNLKYWELDLNTKNFNKLKIGIVVDLPDDEVHGDFTNRELESVIKTVNTDKN